MNDNTNKPQNAFTVINGGVDHEAVMMDGTKEQVRIKLVPVKDYPKYAAVIMDEGKMAEMFCDKPEGWSENLHPGSHADIIEKGEEINLSFFGRYFQRKLELNRRMLGEKFESFLKDQVSALKSTSPSLPEKQA